MIYSPTIRIVAVIGNEHSAIDQAIETGLAVLNKEAGVPVLLTNVIPTPLQNCLCVTILARPLEGQEQADILENTGILGALGKLNWGSETTEGTAVKPFIPGVNL